MASPEPVDSDFDDVAADESAPGDLPVLDSNGKHHEGDPIALRTKARDLTADWRVKKAELDAVIAERDKAIQWAATREGVTMADVVRDTDLARVTVERIVKDPPYHRPRKHVAHEATPKKRPARRK